MRAADGKQEINLEWPKDCNIKRMQSSFVSCDQSYYTSCLIMDGPNIAAAQNIVDVLVTALEVSFIVTAAHTSSRIIGTVSFIVEPSTMYRVR